MSSNLGDIGNPLRRWLFLTGSRTGLAILLSGGVVALSAVFAVTGVIYVGHGSNLGSALSSGLLSGLLTIITVVLSINQLILSRIFGSPADLTGSVEGSIEFRERVERIADVPVSPNGPAAFLGLVGRTLTEQATALDESLEPSGDRSVDVERFATGIGEYGDHVSEAGETEDPFEVLAVTLGTGYAHHLTETRRVRALTSDLPAEAEERLDAIHELLVAVATMRQFYKTVAIQQDLALLSRQLIYTGLAAVLTTFYLSQVYTADSSVPAALPEYWLPLATSVAAGVIFLPLTVIIAYLLRVATVTLYTASVGSFVPPIERVDDR